MTVVAFAKGRLTAYFLGNTASNLPRISVTSSILGNIDLEMVQ